MKLQKSPFPVSHRDHTDWARYRPLYLLEVFLILILAACNLTSRSVTFRDLCVFNEDEFGAANSDQVLARIREKYQVDPKNESRENFVRYYWQLGRTDSEVGLLDNHLVGFQQRGIEGGPQLGQVVGGLGTPDALYRYASGFEGVQYQIILEYPRRGVTVMASRTAGPGEVRNVDGELSLHLSEDIKSTDINCFVPVNSLDDLLRQVYQVPPESMEMQRQRIVTWPGFGAWVPFR
jgi:hypothetical protein